MPPWGGYLETRTRGLPSSHLFYSYGAVFSSFETRKNSTHRTCKFAFSPWSKYLTRLWSRRPISREGAHPFNWGRTLLVQLGGVFFDKTLAQSPSAAPVRFCFMAHGSHRFIVCSVQGSLRGPHRKRCATSRGPPCKQGATIATLHFIISVLLFCQISHTIQTVRYHTFK